jgi:3-oxoadipate enol-lactonase
MAVASRDGAWLAWRSEGPLETVADPQPLLLIMGLAGSARMWFRLLPRLSKHHQAIVFDNRGTGDSDPVDRRLRMADLVDDALCVLDAAGVERAHVIGVSMGGMIAQQLALDHRDRVRSLVLGCTTAGGRRGAPPWRLLATSALRPLLGPQRTFPIVAPALYSPHTRRDRPERVREDLHIRMTDATSARTIYAQLAAIAGHDTRARLHELGGLPTLVLHGEDDTLVSPDRGRELAAAIPGARLELLPTCGHMLSTDAEEPVSRAIMGHVERSARLSASAA